MIKNCSAIFLFVLIAISQSKSCSKLANDAYNINYRDNEIFKKPLADFFNLDGTSSVSLTPQNANIQIIDYIEQIKTIAEPQFQSIHGAKGKIQNGRWENQFAFIEYVGITWNLHITDQSATNRLPEFVTTIKITDEVGTKCFDLAFSGDDILIDCRKDNNDLLFRYLKGATQVELIDTHPKIQDGITKRILDAGKNIVTRGCLYDAQENSINVIQVRVNNLYIQSIDSTLLAQLLNQPQYQLQIVSFKQLDNGIPFVSIFDKAGNFIIMRYLNNEWGIYYQEQLGITDALKFDFKDDGLYQPSQYLIVGTQKTTVIKSINRKKYTYSLPLALDTVYNAWISQDNYMIYYLLQVYQIVLEQSSLQLKSTSPVKGLWMIPDAASNQFSTLTYLYTINQQKYLSNNGRIDGVFNLVYNTQPACTVKVTLAKLGDFRLAVRQPGFESIKNPLFGGTERQDYFENYDGAGIKYVQTVTDRRVQLNFIKYSDLKLKMDEQLAICTFKQVLTIPKEENSFYQIQQLTSLQVLISKCSFNGEYKEGQCTLRSEYLETVKFTSQNAQFYIYNNVVRGVIIKSQNEIVDFIDNDNKQSFTTQAVANVKAISVSLNYIYAITDTQTQMYWISPTQLLFQFQTTFGLQTIKQIFTSPNHNKILIQTENSFLVGQIDVITYFFTYAFEYDPLYRATALLFQDNFIIMTVDATNSIQMQQFDFQDLFNVKQLFIIPTYTYKIEGQIQITSDLISNYYVVVKDSAKTLYNILNFRTTGVSSTTLYQVITTTNPSIIAACDKIIYFQTGQVDHYAIIPQQMKVETIFYLPQTEYFGAYQVEIYAQTNEIQKTRIVQQLNVVQTQEDITLDVMNININNNDFNKGDKCTDLGTKFYNGEVTHFTVGCENCKDGTLEIQNRVQFDQTLKTEPTPAVSSLQLDTNIFVLLTKSNISLYTKGQSSSTNLPTGCTGMRLIKNNDGTQLYVICDQLVSQQLITYTCKDMKCIQSDQVALPETIKVRGFTVLANFVYIVFEDRILVYMIVNTKAELKQTIMTPLPGVIYAQARSLSNTINQLYLNFAQAILVIEFKNVDNLFTEIQRFNIDLNELLTTNKKYISAETYFMKSQIYKIIKESSTTTSTTITLKSILISSNTAHYGLDFIYNCDANKCTQARAPEIPFMINQYLDWKAIYGQINNYLGIVYQKNGQLLQVIYNVPQAATTLPQTMIGAVQENSQISYPVTYGGVRSLLISKNNEIQLYSLQDSPKLCVLDNLEKQYVTITGHNDKDTSSTKFILQVTHTNNEITTSGGNLVWLWVILAIAGTGGIGFGLWKFYQSRRTQTQDGGLLR